MPELKEFSCHCRNCNTSYRPDSSYFTSLVEGGYLPLENVRSAFQSLRGCKSLFLFYENIIGSGSDSFVLVDSQKDPKYVLHIYSNMSAENIERYRKRVEMVREKYEGTVINLHGKEFKVAVNPILEVMSLKQEDCFATLSPYISGSNEYERYSRDYKEYINTKSGIVPISYEMPLREALGFYIDPRNFKVDEENGVVTITDVSGNIAAWCENSELEPELTV